MSIGTAPQDLVTPAQPEARRRARNPRNQAGRRLLRDSDTRLMSRAGAYLYGSGATLVLFSLALPHSPDVRPMGVAAVAGLAVALAAVLFKLGDRFPAWQLALVSPAGSIMVGAVMFFGGGYAIAYSMLYVWAALYSFSFFPPRSALVQGSVIAVTAAVNFLVFQPSVDTPGYLLLVIGTGAVAGVLVNRLLRQVRALARVDAVTGAPNRAAWDDELGRARARAARSGSPMSILIADLDHFKVFNDEYGHQSGDRLLAELVKVWSSVLRETDLLARYGGEEFVIRAEACGEAEAFRLAEKLRELVPSGQTCSIGVAEWDPGEAVLATVERADAALYAAKRAGRNRSVLAPPQGTAEAGPAADTARWASTVRLIVDSCRDGTYDGVTSVYQPVVAFDSGHMVGVEALARPLTSQPWLSVEGMFYTAQRIGLVRELDWLCRRCAVDGAAIFPPGVELFMNVSTVALLDPMHDADQLVLLLRRSGRVPSSVVLELSERERVVDHERLADVIAQYRDVGFRFAIDDFGEGHSGFGLLEATRPEFLKLSQKLSRQAALSPTPPLLAAALAFAAGSGSEVIAEGVEEQAHVHSLTALGVRFGQGYHLGRPASPAVVAQRFEPALTSARSTAAGA